MLYKFIDENTIQQFVGVLKINNQVVANATEFQAKEQGYKELIEEETPTYDLGCQYLTVHYEDSENNITKAWEINQLVIDIDGLKANKITDLSKECEQKIYNGCDITLSDGVSYHFSLTEHDQTDISNIALSAQNGTNMFNKTDEKGNCLYSYHADNENCKYYSANDIITIATKGTQFINFTKTYFNSLKCYVNSLTTYTEVKNIVWGVEIPMEYQSEPYKDLIAQTS